MGELSFPVSDWRTETLKSAKSSRASCTNTNAKYITYMPQIIKFFDDKNTKRRKSKRKTQINVSHNIQTAFYNSSIYFLYHVSWTGCQHAVGHSHAKPEHPEESVRTSRLIQSGLQKSLFGKFIATDMKP